MGEVIRKERLREGCKCFGDMIVWDGSRKTAKFSSHHISDPPWASGTAVFGRNDRILNPKDFLAEHASPCRDMTNK